MEDAPRILSKVSFKDFNSSPPPCVGEDHMMLTKSDKRTDLLLETRQATAEGLKLSIFFIIQFNVPFKIISFIETSQSIGGAKQEYPGKTT